MERKVLGICLDAAEWSILEGYLCAGDMPVLAKLASTGTHVPMAAPPTFRAETPWSVLLSGRLPSESQYWTLVDFDPDTYTPWAGRSSMGSYFYARPDLKTITFDLADAVLAEDVHGIQITGWGSNHPHFPTASQPASIINEIDERFGVNESMLTDGHHAWHNETYCDNLQRALSKSVRQRVEIIKWLDGRLPDWQLFMATFSELHVVLHLYFHALDPAHPLHGHPSTTRAAARVKEMVRLVDDALGDIIEHFGAEVALVPFTLNGMESNNVDALGSVLIPELLHRQRFGEPLIDFPAWDPSHGPIELDQKVLDRHYIESLLRVPTPTTTRGGRALAVRALRQLRSRLPADRLGDLEKLYWRRPHWWEMSVRPVTSPQKRDVFTEAARSELEFLVPSWYRTHWPDMEAFVVPGFSECHIRVNLQGRERDGVIAPDDYAATLDRIEADLRRIVNPRTGNPVVDECIRLRLDDPGAEIGPPADLAVTFTEVADVIEHPGVGIVGQVPLMRTGQHTTNAWALVPNETGPRQADTPRETWDLPATFIEMVGLPGSPTVTGTSFLAEAQR